jgi:prolyl 4-hydroxylase
MSMKQSHSINGLNNFIAGWYIDPELCDSIVEQGERNPSHFNSGIKQYRDCDLKKFNPTFESRYCKELWHVIEEYKKVYPFSYKEIHPWGWTPPRIQRYDPGKFYNNEHCENTGFKEYTSRHLAYMTYLNDIEDGGGTEFLLQGVTTKAEKGLTLIWPAGWTHYHRGVVSNTETKYIITGWLVFSWLK